jgi:hypothetical protein
VSVAKYFFLAGLALFLAIGVIGYVKRPSAPPQEMRVEEAPIELALPSPATPPAVKKEALALAPPMKQSPSSENLPDADRIQQLFALDSSRLPIVETLSFTSRVPWLKGRPAWIADYATQYATSRHFIARSLNRTADYLTQKISPGDRFNVFKKDKNIQFHLLIDISRCRLWFYYIDLDQNERVLLKTYRVGIGRIDPKKASGFLTPLGKYSLGEKIAIYKPGIIGSFQDRKIEMLQVFGTRWIPFEKEIEGCTEAAKGFGIHGAPWIFNVEKGQWLEDRSKIGQYDSDGCVRLYSEDIEEIFSIVITKPTFVEIVRDFQLVHLNPAEKK